jgi:hypothetical protein
MIRVCPFPASAAVRLQTFLSAYAAAPADADVEIRIGETEHGNPAIAIDLSGARHGFTAREARIVADAAEAAMRAHPTHPDTAGLANLILCLREGADRADAAARERSEHLSPRQVVDDGPGTTTPPTPDR